MLRLLATLSSEEAARVSAAVAVSTPFDLARSCSHLQRGASRLYQWHFVRKLRRKALSKTIQHPGIASREAVARARTFLEFDDAFTSVVHGFRDASDYYQRCSSISVLSDIRVPTLLLSARDDPFHPPGLLDDVAALAAANPALSVEFWERGGHVGFVAGSPFRPRYYADQRAAEFIDVLCRAHTTSIDQQAHHAAR
jgi:predicted alpha/beta-fold hydrolase